MKPPIAVRCLHCGPIPVEEVFHPGEPGETIIENLCPKCRTANLLFDFGETDYINCEAGPSG